jgi:hypothetical protein
MHNRLQLPVVGQFDRVTPAMAAGVAKTLWSMQDMVGIIEEWEARHAPRLADRLVG